MSQYNVFCFYMWYVSICYNIVIACMLREGGRGEREN